MSKKELGGNKEGKNILDEDRENSLAVRRGRPAEFSDDQLRNRRDQFVLDFDAAWADIGWELPRCSEANDFIRLFDSLPYKREEDLFSVFRRPSSEPPDSKKLRDLRSIRRSLGKLSYLLEQSKREVHERLQQSALALTIGTKKQRGLVKRNLKKQRKEASRIEQEHKDLSGKKRSDERQIKLLEASIARWELRRFVKSERYEVNPMNLANAIANVPYSGWRQSMRRCKRMPSYLGIGPIFGLVNAMRYLLERANSETETTIINDVRVGISALPSRYKEPRERLASHWFYVERAVRQAYRDNPTVQALPFRIISQYLRQIRSKSREEIGLAEQVKINL